MCWFLSAALYLLVYFFSGLFWDSDVWVSTHFDHWPNLKKVGWLFNWPHVSLQPGWCSSFCGWVTFKELLRISYTCLNWIIVMQPSWLHLFTTSFYGGLEIMNPEMDEDPRNFLDVVAATDPWLPPHPLITQPESASFRPLPCMAPPMKRCTPTYTLDQQGI